MSKEFKYDIKKALSLLEKGLLHQAIEVRTGKNNVGNAFNQQTQLEIICNDNKVNPSQYYFTYNITDIKPKTQLVNKIRQWKRNKRVDLIYRRTFLIVPVNSELGTLFKLYDGNNQEAFLHVIDMIEE